MDTNSLGLRVESTLPLPYSLDIDVNSDIKITFNKELDTSSIIGNFLILEDTNKEYVKDKELDIKKYTVLKGTVTYKDKTIIFSPSEQLNKKVRYIIYVRKNTVRDILGNTMIIDYISYFDTEGTATIKPCEIIEPTNNSIITSLNKVELENLQSDKYILQISKQKTFENIIYDKIENSNVIEKDFKLKDGLYYIRAKAVNGNFGEVIQITVRSHKETITTDQDIDEGYIYEPLDDNELEVIESFPNSINVHEKTNLCYMKFEGNVDIDLIDFEESNLYGYLSDSEDEGIIKEHGYVDGSFSLIYNEQDNCTYIIFTPVSV